MSPDGDNLPDLLWSLIERAWAHKAAERPSVQIVAGILGTLARPTVIKDPARSENALEVHFKTSRPPIRVAWASQLQHGFESGPSSPLGPEGSTDSLFSLPKSANTVDVQDQSFDPEASTYSFHSLPQRRRRTQSSIYSVQSTLSPISDWGASSISVGGTTIVSRQSTQAPTVVESPSQQPASPDMENAISAGLGTTDPNVIQTITLAMNGEYMYKYSHRIFGKDIRHKRFFWVHPYTRVLFWGLDDPRDADEQAYKSSESGSVHYDKMKLNHHSSYRPCTRCYESWPKPARIIQPQHHCDSFQTTGQVYRIEQGEA